MDPQLQLFMQQMVANNNQLMSQMQNAFAVAAAAQPAPRPAAPQRAKLNAPSLFSGNPATIETWGRELDQQCGWYNYNTDADKVAFALAHIRGPALDWWSSLTTGEQRTHSATVDALMNAIRARFQVVNHSRIARNALFALKQGGHSVQNYVSAFNRLVIAVPNMHESDRVALFLKGLNSSLHEKVIMALPADDSAITLTEAISAASRLGGLAQYAHNFQSHPYASHYSPAASPSSSSSAMDLSAMEMNNIEGLEPNTRPHSSIPSASAEYIPPAVQAELQSLRQQINAMNSQRGRQNSNRPRFSQSTPKGMSNEQRRQHLDSRTCFTCGSADHFVRDCPQKKQSTN
jgi:hypothetical protein